jgi:hypothetical protein
MSHPGRDEAAAYYFIYIDKVTQDDVVGVMEKQLGEASKLFAEISEEKSLGFRSEHQREWSAGG